MKKTCKYCSGSGIYIDYVGYTGHAVERTTSGINYIPYQSVPCRSCNGTGWIDDEEVVSVPRKFVKEEYWKR